MRTFVLLCLTAIFFQSVFLSPGSRLSGFVPFTHAAEGAAICPFGEEWRLARPSDHVCVSEESREEIQRENAEADRYWVPTGANGPYTCQLGRVWREAYIGDVVCVTPDRRAEVMAENRNEGIAGNRGAVVQQEAGLVEDNSSELPGSTFSVLNPDGDIISAKPFGNGLVVSGQAGSTIVLQADMPVLEGESAMTLAALTLKFMTSGAGVSLRRVIIAREEETLFSRDLSLAGNYLAERTTQPSGGTGIEANNWNFSESPLATEAGSMLRLEVSFPEEVDAVSGTGSFFIKGVVLASGTR